MTTDLSTITKMYNRYANVVCKDNRADGSVIYESLDDSSKASILLSVTGKRVTHFSRFCRFQGPVWIVRPLHHILYYFTPRNLLDFHTVSSTISDPDTRELALLCMANDVPALPATVGFSSALCLSQASSLRCRILEIFTLQSAAVSKTEHQRERPVGTISWHLYW